MYPYKKILVGLDLTDHDGALVGYASLLARLAGSHEVRFLHVFQSHELPAGISRKYPTDRDALFESAKSDMEETVARTFTRAGNCRTVCRVATLPRLRAFLDHVRKHEIDLVVVGKRTEGRMRGVPTEKLARKTPCSVVFVPPDHRPTVSRIMVAVDFSEYSALAVEEAVALASAAGIGRVLCVHAYRVPAEYSRAGVPLDQLSGAIREAAEDEFQRFVNQIDLKGVTLTPLFQTGDRSSRIIHQASRDRNVDLLIVGARGRGAGAAFLLGSVTERLIRLARCPLLAVKRKGEGMGILDTLFGT